MNKFTTVEVGTKLKCLYDQIKTCRKWNDHISNVDITRLDIKSTIQNDKTKSKQKTRAGNKNKKNKKETKVGLYEILCKTWVGSGAPEL